MLPDQVHRLLLPGPHLLQGDGLTGVAAVPAREIVAVFGTFRRARIERIVDLTPVGDTLLRQYVLIFLDGCLGDLRMRNDIRGEGLVARPVLPDDRRRVLDGGMLTQDAVDLAEFNAVTTDLYLGVVPTKEFQIPIGAPPRHVARLVYAIPGDVTKG